MRKNAKYILVSLMSFCFAVNVNAAECSYEKQVELNNIASTVKATYEETEIDTGETESYVDEDGIIDESKQIPIKEKGFNVKVLNLTENTYIKVNNETTGVSKEYYYSDSDNGTVTIGTYKADKVYSYSIVVRAIDNECSGIELRTINFVTPMYNPYSKYSFCKEYPNFEYCQEYTTDSSFDLNDFIAKSNAYRNSNKKDDQKNETKKTQNKFLDFIKKNKKLLIVIGSIILIAGVTTIVIIIIRKRSRLI